MEGYGRLLPIIEEEANVKCMLCLSCPVSHSLQIKRETSQKQADFQLCSDLESAGYDIKTYLVPIFVRNLCCKAYVVAAVADYDEGDPEIPVVDHLPSRTDDKGNPPHLNPELARRGPGCKHLGRGRRERTVI